MTNHNPKHSSLVLLLFFLLSAANPFIESAWGKENIVLIRPLGIRYKIIEQEIRNSNEGSAAFEILTADERLKESEIDSKMASVAPKAVVLIDSLAYTVFKKYQYQTSGSDKAPVIAILPVLPNDRRWSIRNGFVIGYDLSIAAGVERLQKKLGTPVDRVGIIYRSNMDTYIRNHAAILVNSNIQVKTYMIPSQAPDAYSLIKKHISDLAGNGGTIALWIPNDPLLINAQTVLSLWKPFVEMHHMLAIVPHRMLLSPDSGFGALYMTPDFKAIGKLAGTAVSQIVENNWKSGDSIPQSSDLCQCFYGPALESYAQAAALQKNEIAAQDPLETAASQSVPGAGDSVRPVKAPAADSTAVPVMTAARHENKSPSSPALENGKKGKKQKKNPDSVDVLRIQKVKATIPRPPVDEQVNTFALADTGSTVQVAGNQVDMAPSGRFDALAGMLRKYGWLIVIAALLLLLVPTGRKLLNKVKKNNPNPDGRNCLIISKDTAKIPCSRNAITTTTFRRYFTRKGYSVQSARELRNIEAVLLHSVPTIICVDSGFEANIQTTVLQILSEWFIVTDILVIFYNSQDTFSINKKVDCTYTYHVDSQFTAETFDTIIDTFMKSKSEASSGRGLSNDLEGKITNYDLVRILQLLGEEKKTGCLLLEHRYPFGMIFFNDGKIIHAITATAAGRQAVFSILNLKEGIFRFNTGKRPIATNMQSEVMQVLLEWSVETDEGQMLMAANE